MGRRRNMDKVIRIAEFMIAHPQATRKFVAEKIGIDERQLYKYLACPEFREYYNERVQEIWADSVKEAQANMVRLMRDNSTQISFKATEYILNSAGFNATQKIEANVNTEINVNVVNDDKSKSE